MRYHRSHALGPRLLALGCGDHEVLPSFSYFATGQKTTPKLIPIVTTQETPTIDAVELAKTYIHRWPAQENILKDYLLPLGLDTNHGFAKVAVENSEVAKRRTHLEQRLTRLKRWAQGMRLFRSEQPERFDRLRTSVMSFRQRMELLHVSPAELSTDYPPAGVSLFVLRNLARRLAPGKSYLQVGDVKSLEEAIATIGSSESLVTKTGRSRT